MAALTRPGRTQRAELLRPRTPTGDLAVRGQRQGQRRDSRVSPNIATDGPTDCAPVQVKTAPARGASPESQDGEEAAGAIPSSRTGVHERVRARGRRGPRPWPLNPSSTLTVSLCWNACSISPEARSPCGWRFGSTSPRIVGA